MLKFFFIFNTFLVKEHLKKYYEDNYQKNPKKHLELKNKKFI